MKYGMVVTKWVRFRHWQAINELWHFKVPVKFQFYPGAWPDANYKPFVPYPNYGNLYVPSWFDDALNVYYKVDAYQDLDVLEYLTKMFPELRRRDGQFFRDLDARQKFQESLEAQRSSRK